MSKKLTSKNTKAQILSAYDELEARCLQLEKEKCSLEKAKKAGSPVKPKQTGSPSEQGADKTDMKMVIGTLGNLGEQFNTALSQLSGDLLVEASRLRDIRSKAKDETRRLSELYDLEIGDDTLTQLLRQYTETSETCDKELGEKRESLDKDHIERNRAWHEEREESIRQMKEHRMSDKKNQAREIAEYTYDMELRRSLSDEDYARQKKEQDQLLEDIRKARHTAWDEREKLLSEQEKQFEENKEKVENFPKELENAVKKAKEEGAGIARKQAKIKSDLRTREISGDQAVSHLKIQTLEDEIRKQSVRIETLTQQLDMATQQAQELAIKAIEGASSQTSFRELKELAMEQAKNPSKTK